MTNRKLDTPTPQTEQGVDRLFRPSWIDRLVDWITGLPGPSWLAFLVLFILLGLLSHAGFWLADLEPFGSFSLVLFQNQIWLVSVLFFHNFLDQDARRALVDFRRLMDVSDEQFTRDMYAFTNLPARPVLLLTLIGIPIALYLDPGFPGDPQSGGSALSPLVFVGAASLSLALIFSYRILRQVRAIGRFYLRASAIDLYDLDPVYALASHAARTGLALLLAVYVNFVITPEALEVSSLVIPVVLLTLLATGAFLLPLRGINRRLVDEKRKLLRMIRSRIKSAFEQADLRFDANELDELSTIDSAVSALQNQKAFIESIPTWPWQASTLRGFLSWVLLPIFIWVIQQILSRLLDS